jgi:hypothetical protein
MISLKHSGQGAVPRSQLPKPTNYVSGIFKFATGRNIPVTYKRRKHLELPCTQL